MIKKYTTLDEIVNNNVLTYSLYTVLERAIPYLMDGFKPVQRFVMYEALNKASKDFAKVASIGSSVSDSGYKHGETAALDTTALISNTWNNNIPFLEGQGNFGSRVDRDAAEPRYIFCRVHENFNNIYLDNDILPPHPDKTHLPPKYYLPIIPTVLLNGISGTASGFATVILPHDIKSVIQSCIDVLDGKKDVTIPEVKFPEFVGDVIETEPNKFLMKGKYEWTGKYSLTITEIPYMLDRMSYISKFLQPLKESKILNYEEMCSEGFEFTIRFSKNYLDEIKDKFNNEDFEEFISKLIGINAILTQIIVLVDDGEILTREQFNDASDVVKLFVPKRLSYYPIRIKNKQDVYTNETNVLRAKCNFIKLVRNESIILKDRKKQDIIDDINSYEELKGYDKELLSMSIYSISDDEFEKLNSLLESKMKELDYWNKADPKKEYKKDLKNLLKIYS